jgi:hypothetical protein
MAGVADNDQLAAGPSAMHRPRYVERARHVVAAVYQNARNVV